MGFSEELKKVELSLRSQDAGEAISRMTALKREATTDRELEIADEVVSLIANGSAEDLEEFFDTVYDEINSGGE